MGGAPLVFVDFDLSCCSKVIYKIPFFESFTRIAGGAEKIASLFLMPIFGRRVTKPLYNPFLLHLALHCLNSTTKKMKKMYDLFLLKSDL